MKSFYDFLVDHDGIIVLNESYQRWVYHRTRINPEEGTLFDSGIDKQLSSENYYGPGLYCTYNPADDLGYNFFDTKYNKKISHFENFGEYEIRGKVNYQNFIILDYHNYHQITNKNLDSFEDHLRDIGLFLDWGSNDDTDAPITDGIRYQCSGTGEGNELVLRHHSVWIKQGYSGCVFPTEQMGMILVIWDKKKFIPHSYRKSELVWSREHQNYHVKSSDWKKITPNIKKILHRDIKPGRLKNI